VNNSLNYTYLISINLLKLLITNFLLSDQMKKKKTKIQQMEQMYLVRIVIIFSKFKTYIYV
jgi:hypothetical protein